MDWLEPFLANTPPWLAIIIALIAMSVTVYEKWSNAKKAKAEQTKAEAEGQSIKGDAADKISEAAVQLLEPYQTQQSQLRELLSEYGRKVEDCMEGNLMLQGQIAELTRRNSLITEQNDLIALKAADCSARIENLEQDRINLLGRIASLEQEREELNHRIQMLESEREAFFSEKDELEKKVSYLDQERRRLEETVIRLQKNNS